MKSEKSDGAKAAATCPIVLLARSKSPYMPRWTEISKWCQQLGRPNIDWFAFVSIYNTGFNLVYVKNVAPYFRLDETYDWKWLEYKKFNPNGIPERDRVVASEVVVDHFGHERSVASVVIRRRMSCSSIVRIPQGHLLHVLLKHGSADSGIVIILESRPLPMRSFAKALPWCH